MKKTALFLFGLGSMIALSVSAANITPSQQQEPQYQEQCVPAVNCYTEPCAQLPCNVPVSAQTTAQEPNTPVPCDPAPCAPDTVCAPAPCNPAPCYPAPCNPGC